MSTLLPPAELIVQNGIGVEPNSDILVRFDQIGRGLIAEMARDGFIQPDFHVLDVGCGLGRLARALTEYLSPMGSYCGIDVCKSSIDWCCEHYRDWPTFTFIHADVFSTHYNPGTSTRASSYRFPLVSDSFDFIFSTSLYSHLLAADAAQYINEMARVLKPGGAIWNTFLLLDEVTTPLASAFAPERPHTYLPIAVEHGRIALPDDPEALSALDRSFVEHRHRACDLKIVDIRNGPWSGRTDNLRASYQDVVIATKLAR